ncbi:hypothetical protein [Algihabitans albus]|uniref:hypothetical protein n=1 Tax=Algihabitans albus TaxID=2164067 RepID=UPI000E5D1CEF|nr:hypothetical protein [Algihabitans albus]
MTQALFPRKAVAALLTTGLTSFGAAAQDEHRDALREPAPEIVLAEPGVPHVVTGRVYWSDHRLAGLCRAFDGHFAKLAGSAVYLCTPRRSGVPEPETGGNVVRR